MMKAIIDIDEEIIYRLFGLLNLPPVYNDEDGELEVDGDALSYAIKLMVELCTD